MVRVKRGNVRVKNRKKILKLAKGFYGSLSTLYRPAKQAVVQALTNAFTGRRDKKGIFRNLWITRINARCHENNISYSRLIDGLKKKSIIINRKMLAEIALYDQLGFTKIVESLK